MSRKKWLTIEEIWEQIEAWLSVTAPSVLASLNPGATEEKIIETEKLIGINFPEELIQSYLIHDGKNKYNMEGLIGENELLSLENIVFSWKRWKAAFCVMFICHRLKPRLMRVF